MHKDEYALAWLALARLPQAGPVTQKKLWQAAGSMAELLAANTLQWQRCLNAEQLALWSAFAGGSHSTLRDQAERDRDSIQRAGATLIHWESDLYPNLLRDIYDPPLQLFCKGDTGILSASQVAVIGSRNASVSGLELAYEFAQGLGAAGLVVSSGLALGIDAQAHQAMVDADQPTVAVMATGIDDVYPKRHRILAERIVASGGALVTEFSPQTAPLAQYFPRRNRIISGLSQGVLVVEASVQSGSLITAFAAVEQGREVFALPGSPRSLHHRGCHELIRQGAHLVESVADIVALLPRYQAPVTPVATLNAQQPALSGSAATLYRAIDYAPVSLDGLLERTAMDVDEVLALLSQLEIDGVISQQYGYYSRL